MNIQHTFNALSAGLRLSSKYPGLFYEVSVQGPNSTTYYYSENGKTHNPSGPAIVERTNGVVVRQIFKRNGYDITAPIEDLIIHRAITPLTDEDGEMRFDEVDLFTIDLSVEMPSAN